MCGYVFVCGGGGLCVGGGVGGWCPGKGLEGVYLGLARPGAHVCRLTKIYCSLKVFLETTGPKGKR